MVRKLTSVEEVVSALGGSKATGELARRASPSAGWNWIDRNGFPPDTYVVIQAALKEIGATAPDALWGMVEPERVAS